MKIFLMIVFLTPLLAYPQNRPACATPMDCYQVEQSRKAETIRQKKDHEEAIFRQEQLELEAAQLRELQEQRAVLEDELTEMNETQSRMEEREIEKSQEKKQQVTE